MSPASGRERFAALGACGGSGFLGVHGRPHDAFGALHAQCVEAREYGACANPYVQRFEADGAIRGDVPFECEEHVLLVLAHQLHLR